MREQAYAAVPGGLAVLRGLRHRVRDGTLSRWRALALGFGLALAWLLLVALVAVFALFMAAAAVTIVLIATGRDPSSDPAVLAAVVAVAVTAVAVGVIRTWRHRRRAARHRVRMRGWADAHGWSYLARSSVLSSRWSAPGVRGGAWVSDVLRRAEPRGEVTSMTLGARRAERSGTHAVMVVGPRRFPALTVVPMTARDRTERAMGGQDIAVESHDVNERWRIRCSDARFAHEVLNPRLLERLDRADVPGLSLLVEGCDVVVHAPGPTLLARVESMADLALDLAALLPAYLPDDYPPFGSEVSRRDRRQPPRRVR